ncbi:MAG TPA: carboxymuconolactone decarboxylase family protein [Xanthobacteraceae bacterium]|nr:carboxymuconolactone decarboxylase family protein [Xanthobacteraceae bacterium]
MSENRQKHDFKNVKVSRLPPLPEPLDPVVYELFEDTTSRGGSILNLHLTKAHAPKLSRAGRHTTRALRSECVSSRLLREIAIVRTSILVGCAYEMHHHRPLALQAGLSEGQFEALLDWLPQRHQFNDQQQALLRYVDQLILDKGNVDDATFAGMEKHFSPQEIVELTLCATQYYGSGLFMKAMQIRLDDPHKKAAPGKF